MQQVKQTTHVKLLEAQTDKISGLLQSYDPANFNTWYTQTALILKNILGKDSDEVRQFNRLNGKARVFISGNDEENNRREHEAYFHDLNAATSLLMGVCEYLKNFDNLSTSVNRSTSGALDNLHEKIKEKCVVLFLDGHYPEAVEKSFKIVRDRLRELTTYEKGSEAFGKGGLYIRGSVNKFVDSDFQNAVKFLTMAIDQFRNEKSHTSDGKIDNSTRAYEYLVLSSLAMHLLDNGEIKENKDEPQGL